MHFISISTYLCCLFFFCKCFTTLPISLTRVLYKCICDRINTECRFVLFSTFIKVPWCLTNELRISIFFFFCFSNLALDYKYLYLFINFTQFYFDCTICSFACSCFSPWIQLNCYRIIKVVAARRLLQNSTIRFATTTTRIQHAWLTPSDAQK